MSFGEELRKLRESRGMTVNQLAMYSDISAALISRIENGKRGAPRPENLKKLSTALKVPYEDLMEKAGYLTKEEMFTTAINSGLIKLTDSDEPIPHEISNEDFESIKDSLIKIFENPDSINVMDPDFRKTFIQSIFNLEEKENNGLIDKTINILLEKKGISKETYLDILSELDGLDENSVDDVLDYIKFKKQKSEGK